MAFEPGSSTRVSGTRLAILALIVVTGLALFFAFAHRTPVVIHPDVEAVP